MRNHKIIAATILFLAAAAHADDALPDAAQEARAQNLFHEIRCVVCQAETIADSPASAAADMRRDVREHIASGDSDDAIKTYLASRYGDFVLMQPPLKPATLLLWFGPALILLAGTLLARRFFSSPLEGERMSASADKHEARIVGGEE